MTIRANAKEFVIEIVSAKQQLHMTSPVSSHRAAHVAFHSTECIAYRSPASVRTSGTL